MSVLQTFDELRDEVVATLKIGSSTTEVARAGTALNKALRNMHLSPGHVFPWAERRGMLLTHAPYTTGTVAIAESARTTVTGTSTAWNTAVSGMGYNNTRAGGKLMFAGTQEIYEVSTVSSDTAITLLTRYTGDALTAATYTYFEDEYALASDFLRFVDLLQFSTDMQIPLVGRTEFRRMFPRNDTRGKPKVACHIQLGFSASASPQHRVVLSPVPDNKYSLPYWYCTSNLAVSTSGTERSEMVDDTDEPIIPLMYREALIYYAQAVYLKDYKDDIERSGMSMAAYTDMMLRFKSDVGAERPQFIAGGRERGRLDRRFDTGNRFDTLRDRWYR